MAHPARAATGHKPTDITPSQRRRLAWHLPDDFDRRLPEEREEILEWVQRVIVSGGTDYRRFQALALRNRYAVRFPGILGGPNFRGVSPRAPEVVDIDEDDVAGVTNTAIDAGTALSPDRPGRRADENAVLHAGGRLRIFPRAEDDHTAQPFRANPRLDVRRQGEATAVRSLLRLLRQGGDQASGHCRIRGEGSRPVVQR